MCMSFLISAGVIDILTCVDGFSLEFSSLDQTAFQNRVICFRLRVHFKIHINGPTIFPVVLRVSQSVSQSVRTKPLREDSVLLTNLSTDQNKTNKRTNKNLTHPKQPKNHKVNTKNVPQNKKAQNPHKNPITRKLTTLNTTQNLKHPKNPTLQKQLKHQTLLGNNLVIQSLLVTKISLQSLCGIVYVCAFITRPRQMVCVISLKCTKMFLELSCQLTQ